MSRTYWTHKRIRDGFERFLKEFGHYPSSAEIDSCEYLPATRTLQRDGRLGILGTRKALGMAVIDQRTGPARSAETKRVLERGLNHERLLESILVAKFGEHFVHAQHPMSDLRKRVDFLVYTLERTFGIDVFYPATYENFATCVRIKEKSWASLNFDLLVVPANPLITDVEIERYMNGRRKEMNPYATIVTMESLLRLIDELTPLHVYEHMSHNLVLPISEE